MMKKSFLLSSMAAIAAMSMLAVGCSSSDDDNNEEGGGSSSTDLAIVLTPDASYAWAANDAVNVFQAVEGTTTYVSEGKFTIASADLASNIFRGTLKEAPDKSKSYRYYVMYPYQSSSSSPDAARISIPTTQTQEGEGSKDHLAGSAFPLYGVSSATSGSSQPTVQMSALASVIEVDVLNSTDVTRTISSINVTATPTLCGTFNADITGSAPAFEDYGTSVSSSVTLNVNGNVTINPGKSGKFYIAVKPFTLSAGETMTITVATDLEDPYVFEITPESDVNFASGATVVEDAELTDDSYSGFIAEPCRLYVPGAKQVNKVCGNWIELGQPGDFDQLTYYTIEFWFKGEDNMVNLGTGMGYYLSNHDHTYGLRIGLQCYASDPNQQDKPYRRIYVYRGGQGAESVNIENWATGWHKDWHYFAISYYKQDENNSFMVFNVDSTNYLKAKLALPFLLPDSTTTKNQMYLFRDFENNNSVSGYIKKIRIWNRGMDRFELYDLMNKTDVDGTEEGLMAAWDFTETVPDPSYIQDKTGHYYAKVVGDDVVWDTDSSNWGEE